MKKMLLFVMAVVCCINYACVKTKFKTVQGKRASYSISIPTDFVDDFPIRSESSRTDLTYGNSQGWSIITAVTDLTPDDTINYLQQFASLSQSEYEGMMNPDGKLNFMLIDRKITDVNGVNSYFVYYRSDRLFYQMLYQFKNRKMFSVTCAYTYNEQDSLMPYFNGIINSVVWSK